MAFPPAVSCRTTISGAAGGSRAIASQTAETPFGKSNQAWLEGGLASDVAPLLPAILSETGKIWVGAAARMVEDK